MDEHTIELLGMRLANRAYLQRIFHIVFGAEPSADELATLGSPETVAQLHVLAEAFREDDLGICMESVASSAAEVLADAEKLCASLGDKADDAAYVEALKSDFTRLFLVPDEAYVHPWESPYIGKEVMLFQESTLDVRHRYAEYGFKAVEFGHFPEDHVSMMMDFLAHLSTRAFDAFGDGRDDEVRRILLSQQDFAREHLLNWLPAFRDKVHENDAQGVYRRLADALVAFLMVDECFVEQALAEIG